MTICLSFAGVAGCIAFHAGATRELLKLAPPNTQFIYAGLSSGSIIASMLALGYDPDTMIEKFEHFTTFFDKWYHHPVTYWFTHVRRLYLELLEPDSYEKVSGKLFIGYSVVTPFGLKARVVNTYTSNDDLINAIFASCHLIPYRLFPVGLYRGEVVCDGAFSCGVIKPPGVVTVSITASIVHSNAFWSDWVLCTCLEKTHRLCEAGSSFVKRHEYHFLQQMKGEKSYISLPRFFNPLVWVKRFGYVWLLVWLLRRPQVRQWFLRLRVL
jgi:hypothetical protein